MKVDIFFINGLFHPYCPDLIRTIWAPQLVIKLARGLCSFFWILVRGNGLLNRLALDDQARVQLIVFVVMFGATPWPAGILKNTRKILVNNSFISLTDPRRVQNDDVSFSKPSVCEVYF